MRLNHAAFSTVVRASAAYDLMLTAPFATPWTFAFAHAQLSALNSRLGGGALPGFDTIHTLFACLMGSIVLVWSVLRLRAPSVRLGRYDGVGRFLFSTWMAWALAVSGTPLLWLFLIPEFCWGVAQWLPVGVQGSGSRTARAPLTSAAPMRSSRGG